MNNLNFSIYLYSLILGVVLLGCEKSDLIQSENQYANAKQIANRSDIQCDECIGQLEATCCCKVSLQPGQGSIDMRVCGVYLHPTESCTGTNYSACYTLNNQGVRVTLTPNKPHLYFCILQNTPFKLWNNNPGTGAGWINIGCSSSGNPTGAIGMNIPNGNDRYFQSDGCDLTICPN